MKEKKERVTMRPSALPGHVRMSVYWPVSLELAHEIEELLERDRRAGRRRDRETAQPDTATG